MSTSTWTGSAADPDQREGAGERKHGATVAGGAPAWRTDGHIAVAEPLRSTRAAEPQTVSLRHDLRQLRLGRRAEQLVATRLERSGWRIVARNVRLPSGELDLVALDDGTLVFVEVKAGRTGATLGPERPAHAVGRRKQPAAAACARVDRGAPRPVRRLWLSVRRRRGPLRRGWPRGYRSHPRRVLKTRSPRRPHRARRDRAVNRRRWRTNADGAGRCRCAGWRRGAPGVE